MFRSTKNSNKLPASDRFVKEFSVRRKHKKTDIAIQRKETPRAMFASKSPKNQESSLIAGPCGLNVLVWRRVALHLQIDDLYSMACACKDLAEACDHDQVWWPLYQLLLRLAGSGSEMLHHSLECSFASGVQDSSLSGRSRQRKSALVDGTDMDPTLWGLPSPPYAANFLVNEAVIRKRLAAMAAPGGAATNVNAAGNGGRGGAPRQFTSARPRLPPPALNADLPQARALAIRQERESDSDVKQKRTALLVPMIEGHIFHELVVFGCSYFRRFVVLAVFVGAPRVIQHLQNSLHIEADLLEMGNANLSPGSNAARQLVLRQLEILFLAHGNAARVRRAEKMCSRDTALAIAAAEKANEEKARAEARHYPRGAPAPTPAATSATTAVRLPATAPRRGAVPARGALRVPFALPHGNDNNRAPDLDDDDDDDAAAEKKNDEDDDPMAKPIGHLDRQLVPLRCTKHFWLWLDTLENGIIRRQLRGTDVLMPIMGTNFKMMAAAGLGLTLASSFVLFLTGKILLPLGGWVFSYVNALLRTKVLDFKQIAATLAHFRKFPAPAFLLHAPGTSTSSSSIPSLPASAVGDAAHAAANISAAAAAGPALLNATLIDSDSAAANQLGLFSRFFFFFFDPFGSAFSLCVSFTVDVVGGVYRDIAEEVGHITARVGAVLANPVVALPNLLFFSAPMPSNAALYLLAVGAVGSALIPGANLPSLHGVRRKWHNIYLKHKLLHNVATAVTNRMTDWWILFLLSGGQVLMSFVQAPFLIAAEKLFGATAFDLESLRKGATSVALSFVASSWLPAAALEYVRAFAASSFWEGMLTLLQPAASNALSLLMLSPKIGEKIEYCANWLVFGAAGGVPVNNNGGVTLFTAVAFFVSLTIAVGKPWRDALWPELLSKYSHNGRLVADSQNLLASYFAQRKTWTPQALFAKAVTVWNASNNSSGSSSSSRNDNAQDPDDTDTEEQRAQIGLLPPRPMGEGGLGARLAYWNAQLLAPRSHYHRGQDRSMRGASAQLLCALAVSSALNAALCIVRWRFYTAGSSIYRVVATETAIRVGISLVEWAVVQLTAPKE